MIAECELRWHVRIAEETFGLSYNFVAPAVTAYGRDVVVKIGVPCRELICEIRALEAYCGGAAVQKRRVELLATELGFDRHRIIGWGLGQAVLSAWWIYEDAGAGWESAMACAETLSRL